MAKWTVALFGHVKNNKDGKDSKRAQPGDVIAYKPFGQDWTVTEKKEFLIISIDGPTKEQMHALTEPQYDDVIPSPPIDLGPGDEVELLPESLKKRRFSIPEADLETVGVDLDKMKDKEVVYTPTVDLVKVDIWDKLNERKVLNSDKIEPYKPTIAIG